MIDPDRFGRKRVLRHAKKRLEYQRELPLATPLKQRFTLWRRGYRGASYGLYDLAQRPDNYLPDTARLETFFINGSFARDILKDKLLFTQLVGGVLDVPEIVGLIERGVVFRAGAATTLAELGAEYPSLVLKPSDGTRGQGVARLEHGRLNGETITEEALASYASKLDNYLVTKTVPQAAYAETIFPTSTNSVRIMTFVDPESGEPFVARAVHRFGGVHTVPTDNWSRGGLCAHVDLASGRLGPGVKHAKRTGGRLEWQTHHPDSGAAIEGTLIPNWHEVCGGLVGAVKALPFLVHVGWDVVITEGGFCVLEGNNNPDVDLLQVHGGLLGDARVRRFYQHHQII